MAFVQTEHDLSERRACKLLEVDRSSYVYEPRPDRNVELREELLKLARQKPRYGYRRLHVLLERRGHAVNVKRIYRLYVEEGLSVRRRKRKRVVRDRAAEPRLLRPNQEWAMDFIMDGLATGRDGAYPERGRCLHARVPGAGGGLKSRLGPRDTRARAADRRARQARSCTFRQRS